jgi:D-alanyl-lipoteichoic acid acyltransferase DltB (MBOAT superfamily)
MLFNSLSYAVFLPVVFALYWLVKRADFKLQNRVLLLASYFFYACWDYRFLGLLIFSTLLDYITGIKMYRSQTQGLKKFWFWTSIIINLSFLGVFKYYNFFVDSFSNLLASAGFQANTLSLQLILPVGISFYTFHGLSYVIDIYNDKIKPETNIIDYSLFVSFFPLLVAGPIERATHLLPQIKGLRYFKASTAYDGLRQILWGLFKKIVIADNCAVYADLIFNNSSDYSGSTLILGAVLFAFQIYGDFSGYSDIALGTARLFGIELLRNFAYPYFSRDIAEFWRRWHISLSSWFKDYLYIPLGGSRGNNLMKIRNTVIIFSVSGFWHGANWTFIVWGLLNAFFIIPSILFKRNRNHLEIVAQGKMLPTINEFIAILFTFVLTSFAWIFFRAESLNHAVSYISGIWNLSEFWQPQLIPNLLIFLVIAFVFIEWLGREKPYGLQVVEKISVPNLRLACYFGIVFTILFFGNFQANQFIYFQF